MDINCFFEGEIVYLVYDIILNEVLILNKKGIICI